MPPPPPAVFLWLLLTEVWCRCALLFSFAARRTHDRIVGSLSLRCHRFGFSGRGVHAQGERGKKVQELLFDELWRETKRQMRSIEVGTEHNLPTVQRAAVFLSIRCSRSRR